MFQFYRYKKSISVLPTACAVWCSRLLEVLGPVFPGADTGKRMKNGFSQTPSCGNVTEKNKIACVA